MTAIIATRALKLRQGQQDLDVEVRIFAPRSENDHWSCDYEIDWPEGMREGMAHGYDSAGAFARVADRRFGTLYQRLPQGRSA